MQFSDFASTHGNFEQFAQLSSVQGKDNQSTRLVISVGGYAHDNTFEAIFNPQADGTAYLAH